MASKKVGGGQGRIKKAKVIRPTEIDQLWQAYLRGDNTIHGKGSRRLEVARWIADMAVMEGLRHYSEVIPYDFTLSRDTFDKLVALRARLNREVRRGNLVKSDVEVEMAKIADHLYTGASEIDFWDIKFPKGAVPRWMEVKKAEAVRTRQKPLPKLDPRAVHPDDSNDVGLAVKYIRDYAGEHLKKISLSKVDELLTRNGFNLKPGELQEVLTVLRREDGIVVESTAEEHQAIVARMASPIRREPTYENILAELGIEDEDGEEEGDLGERYTKLREWADGDQAEEITPRVVESQEKETPAWSKGLLTALEKLIEAGRTDDEIAKIIGKTRLVVAKRAKPIRERVRQDREARLKETVEVPAYEGDPSKLRPMETPEEHQAKLDEQSRQRGSDVEAAMARAEGRQPPGSPPPDAQMADSEPPPPPGPTPVDPAEVKKPGIMGIIRKVGKESAREIVDEEVRRKGFFGHEAMDWFARTERGQRMGFKPNRLNHHTGKAYWKDLGKRYAAHTLMHDFRGRVFHKIGRELDPDYFKSEDRRVFNEMLRRDNVNRQLEAKRRRLEEKGAGRHADIDERLKKYRDLFTSNGAFRKFAQDVKFAEDHGIRIDLSTGSVQAVQAQLLARAEQVKEAKRQEAAKRKAAHQKKVEDEAARIRYNYVFGDRSTRIRNRGREIRRENPGISQEQEFLLAKRQEEDPNSPPPPMVNKPDPAWGDNWMDRSAVAAGHPTTAAHPTPTQTPTRAPAGPSRLSRVRSAVSGLLRGRRADEQPEERAVEEKVDDLAGEATLGNEKIIQQLRVTLELVRKLVENDANRDAIARSRAMATENAMGRDEAPTGKDMLALLGAGAAGAAGIGLLGMLFGGEEDADQADEAAPSENLADQSAEQAQAANAHADELATQQASSTDKVITGDELKLLASDKITFEAERFEYVGGDRAEATAPTAQHPDGAKPEEAGAQPVGPTSPPSTAEPFDPAKPETAPKLTEDKNKALGIERDRPLPTQAPSGTPAPAATPPSQPPATAADQNPNSAGSIPASPGAVVDAITKAQPGGPAPKVDNSKNPNVGGAIPLTPGGVVDAVTAAPKNGAFGETNGQLDPSKELQAQSASPDVAEGKAFGRSDQPFDPSKELQANPGASTPQAVPAPVQAPTPATAPAEQVATAAPTGGKVTREWSEDIHQSADRMGRFARGEQTQEDVRRAIEERDIRAKHGFRGTPPLGPSGSPVDLDFMAKPRAVDPDRMARQAEPVPAPVTAPTRQRTLQDDVEALRGQPADPTYKRKEPGPLPSADEIRGGFDRLDRALQSSSGANGLGGGAGGDLLTRQPPAGAAISALSTELVHRELTPPPQPQPQPEREQPVNPPHIYDGLWQNLENEPPPHTSRKDHFHTDFPGLGNQVNSPFEGIGH